MTNDLLHVPRTSAQPFDQDSCTDDAEETLSGMCHVCRVGLCGHCSNPDCSCPHPLVVVGRAIVELHESVSRTRQFLGQIGGVARDSRRSEGSEALSLFDRYPQPMVDLIDRDLIVAPDRADAAWRNEFIAAHRECSFAEVFLDLVLVHGRNEGPKMLSRWVDGLNWSGISTEVPAVARSAFLRDVLATVWSGADYPEGDDFPRRWWIALFRDAQFPRPVESLVIYRGVPSDRRLGMSWTTDANRAQWFANRYKETDQRRNTYVYTATAEPKAILCQMDESLSDRADHEGEIVVDPLRLRNITRIGTIGGQ